MTAEIASCRKKAERFLKSYLKEKSRNCEEAAVYFLSRKRKNETISNAIDESIQRWRDDKTHWEDKSLDNAIRAASILRLVQWAEIGVLREYRDNICQSLDLPSNHDFLTCLHSGSSAFFPLVFPLFTSDIAIREMRSRLIGQLYLWQDYLIKIFMKKGLYVSLSFNQPLSTLVAAFVFGVYRLQCGSIDKKILERSVQYLLDDQADSGLWGYDDSEQHPASTSFGEGLDSEEQSENVVLTAMGIHALFVAKPFGAERCIENAAQWLLGHQGSDGGWYHLGNPKNGYGVHATVLALDALAIAITPEKKKPVITYGKSLKIDNFRTDILRKETKVKPVVSKEEDEYRRSFVTKLKDAIFIIEDDNSLMLSFGDEDPRPLGIKKNHALALIPHLVDGNGITSKEVSSITESPGEPTKIIRDANRSLIEWIRKAGFSEFPHGLKIIVPNDEDGKYHSLISTLPRSEYNKRSLKEPETHVYDHFENVAPDD